MASLVTLEEDLIAAADRGDLDTVQDAIKSGANVNQINRYGQSPLMRASANGHTEVARLLIHNGAQVDLQDNVGLSALMEVSRCGHAQVAKLLLQSGATVDLKDNDGWSALMETGVHGHTEVAQLLLLSGAQVDLQDDDGWSALMLTSMYGHTELIKLLLENGAQVDLQDSHGSSALIRASQNENTEVAKLLLQNGAQVDIKDDDGWSALTWGSINGHFEVAKLLIHNGAQVDLQDIYGSSALIYASRNEHIEVAELLIQNGAQIDLQDNYGSSALIRASRNEHIEVARLLIQNGAKIDLQDNLGWSALMDASMHGHVEVARLLLQNGAEVDLQDRDGWSALMRASENGQTEMANLLLQNGAQVELQYSGGWSALTVAKDTEMASLLQGVGHDNEVQNCTEVQVANEPTATAKGEAITDKEDKAEMEEFIKGIEKAIAESGRIDRKLAHIMFVGPPGSGKSSLMDRLLGRLREEFSTSTGVCDSIVIVDIDTANPSTFHSITIVDPHTWKEIESNASFVGQMGQESIVSHHQKGESKYQSEIHKIKSPVTDAKTTKLPQTKPPGSPLSSFTFLRKSINSVIKQHGFKTFKKYLKKTCSLYLRDTGGQVEFQEMIALLIHGPSIFVFVFRADLDLKEKFKVEYRKSVSESLNSYTSSITTEEALLQCLASIYAMDTSNEDIVKTHQPLVFIVGTHMDQLGSEREKKIANLNYHLDSIIKNNGFDHIVQYADERKGDVMFTVDNTSRYEDSFELIRSRVSNLIMNRSEFSIEYPISYLLFCLDLQNINKSILTLEECCELAASHGIVGDQVLHLLRFLHLRIGIIRYYDVEGLRHLVILEPQVLFNRTTDVIAMTFSSGSFFPGEVTDLEKKGILSVRAFASLRSVSDKIGPKEFLQLLVHLRISAPFHVAGDQEERYFIPCVLNHVPEATVLDPETDITPLYVKFKCDHCPKGIFGVLVTHLMRPERGNNTTFTLLENKIFKDQVSFKIHSASIVDEMSLKISFSHIQITFYPELSQDRTSPLKVVCNNVHEIIVTSISRALKDLHYKREKIEPMMCLKCELCSQLHQVEKRNDYHITRCGRRVSCMPPNGRCWYNEDYDSGYAGNHCSSSQSLSVSSPQTPPSIGTVPSHHGISSSSLLAGTLHSEEQRDHHCTESSCGDMFRELLPLASEWQNIGILLGIPTGDLEAIQRSYPHQQRDCLREMIKAWLRMTEPAPTWEGLVEAVKLIDSKRAQEIHSKYISHTTL